MDLVLRPQSLVVIENSSPPLPPASTEAQETWTHISVALAPVVARMRRLRALDAEGGR